MFQRAGGSFAPPLSDAKLAEYRALVAALPAQSQVRDAMTRLLACCAAWWALPDSAGTPTRAHPSGVGTIVMLDPAHQSALFDHIPWMEELVGDTPGVTGGYAKLFDGIDPVAAKPLRDAAHSLLWHAVELCHDREPITADRL